ncbi:hypothetical protein SGFS_058280 [Streptomyces graminofaciens]|uniref:HTH marR-type domain-containing protein n=1 Tax=Streptomyces graminofaciens TaxID=68212 RepID=A0ABN5VM75_9ACTN|nr:MarR family transcriptional regulator [Streptomyces graminofaciens]BBC34534.1 hypothetical protein SGFS_058280 [Streptomyces graminofaciens]
MAEQTYYGELARQLSAVGAVRRELTRSLPPECAGASAGVLSLLARHGEMRMSRLAELLAVDMSVTSRHVAHVADRGWIDRLPDPADKRSRILRLTPTGLAMVDELHRRSTRMMTDRLNDWPAEEVAELARLLARLRESFDDCRADPRAPYSEDTTSTTGTTGTTGIARTTDTTPTRTPA